ncbi:hypothetical protein Plhal304r1_c027g0089681 [Plasmopara halstedii]
MPLFIHSNRCIFLNLGAPLLSRETGAPASSSIISAKPAPSSHSPSFLLARKSCRSLTATSFNWFFFPALSAFFDARTFLSTRGTNEGQP